MSGLSALASYACALGAALMFAVSATLTHRSAAETPAAQGIRPPQLLRFARATLAHPRWRAGAACSAAGLGLHAAALHAGALAVVQPVLVLVVPFALLLQRQPRPRQLWWALALLCGLAGFLLVATTGITATDTAERASPDSGLVGIAALLALGAIGTCLMIARGRAPTTAAGLLGVAAGIAFAVTATLIKACTYLLAPNPITLLSDWALYALLATGALGLLCNQLAFQAGPLSASLPAITVVNPLLSVLIGVTIYHENLRHTPWAIVTESGCMLLFTTATVVLTRHQDTRDRQRLDCLTPLTFPIAVRACVKWRTPGRRDFTDAGLSSHAAHSQKRAPVSTPRTTTQPFPENLHNDW